MTIKIPDGIYFLHPDGCCWHSAHYRGGKCVDGTEQANMGSHDAARDGWAGVYPSEGDLEVDAPTADRIIRDVLGDDVHVEMVIVTMQTHDAGK